ncbi:MAG: CBS domain-containing protein [Ignavibacteria bacterium]|nr:CBS domain-containing protein [Ignavibacteria bacterium]MCC7158569.1 CBS domain-containing protein [Ignavibacteria bacterium]
MKSLRDICLDKPMHFVNTGISVYEAVKHMAENNVGAVPVLDGDGKLKGIFSERDLMIRCAAKKLDMNNTKIDEVMTKGVILMEAADSYEECIKIMQQENIRHMPVRDGDKLIGMISMRDLMQEDAEEKKQEIENLNTYIYYYK